MLDASSGFQSSIAGPSLPTLLMMAAFRFGSPSCFGQVLCTGPISISQTRLNLTGLDQLVCRGHGNVDQNMKMPVPTSAGVDLQFHFPSYGEPTAGRQVAGIHGRVGLDERC